MSEGEATDPRCAECQDVSAAYCNRCAPAVFDAMQSRVKVKPEGATDPLREALEALRPFAGCDTTEDGEPRYDEDWPPMTERIKDWLGWEDFRSAVAAVATLRAALAAAPEPEWEYRAVCGNLESGPCGLGTARIYADIDGHIERRRKAGEWEALPDAD